MSSWKLGIFSSSHANDKMNICVTQHTHTPFPSLFIPSFACSSNYSLAPSFVCLSLTHPFCISLTRSFLSSPFSVYSFNCLLYLFVPIRHFVSFICSSFHFFLSPPSVLSITHIRITIKDNISRPFLVYAFHYNLKLWKFPFFLALQSLLIYGTLYTTPPLSSAD